MKSVIVVGHNEVAQGAIRATDGVPEFTWNSKLAAKIKAHDPARIFVLNRVAIGSYSQEIDNVYRKANALGATATIELHFNSVSGNTAAGGLTKTSGTAGSNKLGQIVRSHVNAVMKNRDRGVKVFKKTDRGYRSVVAGKAPAILEEPYFGSNEQDCVIADANMDALAEAYYLALLEFHGEEPRQPAPEPKSRIATILSILFGR